MGLSLAILAGAPGAYRPIPAPSRTELQRAEADLVSQQAEFQVQQPPDIGADAGCTGWGLRGAPADIRVHHRTRAEQDTAGQEQSEPDSSQAPCVERSVVRPKATSGGATCGV
jgi:hypothetical protein